MNELKEMEKDLQKVKKSVWMQRGHCLMQE